MNIIFSGFVHPIIGVVSGYLLIFGSEFTGKILLRKSPYSFFFLNLSTGVIAVSLIAYIFILLGISKYSNIIISYCLIFFGLYNLFFFIKKFNLKIKIDFYFFFILLILFFLFIISISAPTMADALGYHLGVANYINNFNHLPNPHSWLHSSISGLGEVYNSLGLVVFSDTVGSSVQFVSLISFLHYFSKVIIDKPKYILFCLFILGSPVIVFLLSGSKFQIFPQLISTIILYLLVINEKIDFKLSFLLLFLIFGISNIKLTFLISGFILGIFLLSKSKINLKFIFSGLIIFILFFFPKALFNLFHVENFSYLNFFTIAPVEYISVAKNYRENNFFFPLNLFFPGSLGKISTILGFQFLVLFFIKKIKKENIQIFIAVLLVSTMYFLITQSTARIYHEMILWLSLSIIFINKYKVNLNYINIFLVTNSSLVLMIAFLGFYSLFPSLISNDYRQKVMRNNSFEYKGIEWINQNISSNSQILTNLRSISLLKSKSIPMDYLNYNIDPKKLNNYFNFLKNKKINFIVIKNYNKKNNYFFKNCNINLIKQSPKFLIETRNPNNRNYDYSITILGLSNTSLKTCI